MHTYDIRDWRVTAPDDTTLMYRPGWRTVGRRAGITLLCLIVAAVIAWPTLSRTRISPAPPPLTPGQQTLQRSFEQSAIEMGVDPAELERRLAQHQKENRAARARLIAQRDGVTNIALAFAGVLVALGFLPIVLAVWQSIRVSIAPDGRLLVRHGHVWKSRAYFDRRRFSGLTYGIQEEALRDRYGRITEYTWLWFLQLRPAPGGAPLRFNPDWRPDRPGQTRRPPERVVQLGRLLEQWSGHKAEGPFILEEASYKRGLFGSRRTLRADPIVTQRTVSDINDLPPEMQNQVRAAFGDQAHAVGDVPFVYEDRNGTRYTRLEDMPPDALARMEEALARETPVVDYRQLQHFTVRGPDGTEQTYDSLDDVPTELRQQIEEAMRQRPHG